MPESRLRFGWLFLALLLGATTGLFHDAPTQASAHALLVRADPPVNAQLREAPTSLSLYFSETLERRFSNVRVVDQNGTRVEDAVTFDDTDNTVMRVSLKPLDPGYITVFWENVSSVDGHRISGSYPLTILNTNGSLPFGTPSSVGVSVSGVEANPGRVTAKVLLLVGGCLLTGAFAFVAFVSPGLTGAAGDAARRSTARRAVILGFIALLLLVGAGIAELALQADSIGTSIGALLDTAWGQRWQVRNLLLVLPAIGLLSIAASGEHRPMQRFGAWLGLSGSVCYLLTAATASHSAAGSGAFWAVTSDFVHLLGASVWLGMLAMLLLLILWCRNGVDRNDRYAVVATALQRFSAVAVVSLSLLLLTGVVNAVIQLGHVDDLIDTAYGRALGLKLLLILPLLGVGAVNAYLLRPEYVDEASIGGQRARQQLDELEPRLLRMMRLELGLAVLVLAVVGVLVQLSPTRGQSTSSAQSDGKLIETAESNGIGVTLVINPNQPGLNSFDVYLTGAVNLVESARLNFTPPSGAASASRLVLEPSNPPTYYVGRGPFINEPGRWKIDVDLRRTEGSDLAIPFNVRVPDPTGGPAQTERGGSFASPVVLTPLIVAVLGLSAILAVGIVIASRPAPDLPAGRLGLIAEDIADRLDGVRLRPAWSLAALIVVGVGLGLILGSHFHDQLTKEQASRGNPVQSSPESIASGRQIFMANCILCHGETGRGDGPLASTLTIKPANLYDHVPYHPDQFFYSVITNGLSGVMPAFGGQLSEEERWNVLNFLRDQFGQPPPEQ